MMPPNTRYFTGSAFLAPNFVIVEACREMFTNLSSQAAGSLAFWQPMKQRCDLPEVAGSVHSEHN